MGGDGLVRSALELAIVVSLGGTVWSAVRAVRRGQVRMPRCPACGSPTSRAYPRCPRCGSGPGASS